MKKFFALLILILSSTMCFACGKDAYISYKREEVYLNLGSTYHVPSGDITVHNSSSDYEIISLDDSVAVISGNVIYSVAEGETTIRIRLVENSAIFKDFRLVVTNIKYVENATIKDERVYVNMGKEEEVYNPIIYGNSDANEVPEVSYNKDIIDYDYKTGKITPKALGDTVVIVLFRDCNVSFRVSVINEIYALSLEVPDCTLLNGYSGKFVFSIFPDNANTYSFFTPTNDYIEVNDDGSYVTKGVGKTTAYCSYLSELNGTPKLISFQVEIIEKVDNIDVWVQNTNSQEENGYFLKENKYRLRIDNKGISSQNIYISGVGLASEITENANGLYVDFFFTKTGKNEIIVEVKLDGYNSIISNKSSYTVGAIGDIQVAGFWSIYPNPIAKQKDGKYHIFLDGNGDPSVVTYIRFGGILNDVVINEIDVYMLINDNREIMNSNTFLPTAKGEYSFEFEYNGNLIGRASVVVG